MPMTNNYKVGVLIATSMGRNELLFSRALPSVLCQTRKADCVLIVDDNTDETVSTEVQHRISMRNDANIHYIKNTKTSGMSGTGAWNSGIEWYNARFLDTDYIAILDDDDSWDIRYLEKCKNAISVGSYAPDLLAAYLKRSDCKTANIFSYEDLVVNSFLCGNPGIQGSNMFIRLGILNCIGGFDESLPSCTDRDLMIRILKCVSKENIKIIPEVLVNHYAWNGSITYNKKKKEQGLTLFFEKHILLYSEEVLRKALDRAESLFSYTNRTNILKLFNLIRNNAGTEKIVIGVAIHNGRNTIRRCLTSILEQKNINAQIWILIADDNSTDCWEETVEDLLINPQIIITKVQYQNVSKTRNHLNKYIAKYFGAVNLIGRLDCDDEYADQFVLSHIENLKRQTDADVIFAGNYLRQNNMVIDRINKASKRLKNPQYLLQRLKSMAEGFADSELPSCNIFLTLKSLEEYPDIPSAEDHFLSVRILLSYKQYNIAFAEGVLLTIYNLDGNMTANNKKKDDYKQAREKLYQEGIRLWKILNEKKELKTY